MSELHMADEGSIQCLSGRTEELFNVALLQLLFSEQGEDESVFWGEQLFENRI